MHACGQHAKGASCPRAGGKGEDGGVEHFEETLRHVRFFLPADPQANPDLPADASLEARVALTRDRVGGLRPLHGAIAARIEAERQRTNFAFVAGRTASGEADAREVAIEAGRRRHDYG